MEGFFPDKFLGEIFWNDHHPLPPPEDQSGFLQYTEIPRIGLGQESSHVGSTSHTSNNNEDEPLLPANQSGFLQYSHLPRIGFGQETSCSIDMNDHGASPPANPSAFVPYRELPRMAFGQASNLGGFSGKMSKKMIKFLRKSGCVERSNMAEYEKERGFRHMINERMRRQRQRQCCLSLHSMLPHGTKNDINSVVQMAAKEIERLQACRDELQRQNVELEANVKAVESSKVQLRTTNPTSTLDSMLETLQFLQGLGVTTTSISSNISPRDLPVILEIVPKIGDAEVERAIKGATSGNEGKVGSQDREVSKRQRTGN